LSLSDAFSGIRRLSLHTPIIMSRYLNYQRITGRAGRTMPDSKAEHSFFPFFGVWLISKSGVFSDHGE
jgi:hypothetical protein